MDSLIVETVSLEFMVVMGVYWMVVRLEKKVLSGSTVLERS